MEALAFGDQIAVLERGRLAQSGSAADLLRHPRSEYVAEFIGLNLFTGELIRRGEGLAYVQTADGVISVVDPGGDQPVFVAIDPRDITLHIDAPGGSMQNVRRGTVLEIVPEPPRGERVRVVIDSKPPLVAEVTRTAIESTGIRPGQQVYAAFKASGVTVYR
jgi:molybdate transport system ATP-binding protein